MESTTWQKGIHRKGRKRTSRSKLEGPCEHQPLEGTSAGHEWIMDDPKAREFSTSRECNLGLVAARIRRQEISHAFPSREDLMASKGHPKSKRDKLEQPRRQRPTRFEIASDPYQYYFESKSKTNTLTSHHPLNLLADDHQAVRDTESASHVHKLRNQALRSEIHVLYSTLP